MSRTTSLAISLLAMAILTVPTIAGVDDQPGQTAAEAAAARAWNHIDDVRLATARYHDLSAAIEDGFNPFSVDGDPEPTCFDGPGGGMGVHYVRGVDDVNTCIKSHVDNATGLIIIGWSAEIHGA